MERYLIDLNNLPRAKKEVIENITSPLTKVEKNSFLKSLIFLGFNTIKQSDIDVTTSYIGTGNRNSENKYRVYLANTPIADFLEKFESKTTKRSCVYAFIYAGINSFIEYQEKLAGKPTDKELKAIEKNLFLCGLSEFINIDLKIEIIDKSPSIQSFKQKTLENKSTKPHNTTQPKEDLEQKPIVGSSISGTQKSETSSSNGTPKIEKATSILLNLNIDAG